MANKYKPCFWDVDYVLTDEKEIDPMENDEAMEAYIEEERQKFREEWYEYLEDDF